MELNHRRPALQAGALPLSYVSKLDGIVEFESTTSGFHPADYPVGHCIQGPLYAPQRFYP
jgi:hypothetical protein